MSTPSPHHLYIPCAALLNALSPTPTKIALFSSRNTIPLSLTRLNTFTTSEKKKRNKYHALLMSRSNAHKGAIVEAEAGASSGASFRSRSSASSSSSSAHRSTARASELRARYEMAQAIQKPWPLHLLENGVKASSTPAGNSASAVGGRGSREVHPALPPLLPEDLPLTSSP